MIKSELSEQITQDFHEAFTGAASKVGSNFGAFYMMGSWGS